MILLDTDACLSFLGGNRKLLELYGDSPDEIGIPAPCVQELFFIAGRSSDPERNTELIETLLLTVRIAYPDLPVLRHAASIQGRVAVDGIWTTQVDLLLYSMTKVYGARLVTAHGKRYVFHVKQ